MGNSPSELVSRAAEQSDTTLENLSKEDLKILNNPWFVLSPADFLARSDLTYDVPGLEVPLKKDEGQNTVQEESMICSLQSPQRLREKHEDVCKALLTEILQQRGEDSMHKETITRLQAFARIYDALVRTQERTMRSSKKEASEKVQKTKFTCLSKASLIFSLNTMINLVKVVGKLNPVVYKKLISQTSEILANTYPCSIASSDPVYIEALSKVSSLFQNVLRGEFPNVSEENQMESISPLFALGLSTGNLGSLLSISSQFIGMKTSATFHNTLKLLHSHLKTLQTVPSAMSYANLLKVGSSTTVTNNSTFVEHRGGTWANGLSEQEFTEGIHYFEFKAEKINQYLSFGIVEAAYATLSAEPGSNVYSIIYQAPGTIKSKSSAIYTWEPWKDGDRIGLLLDMTNKTVNFFRNGVLEAKPAHEGVPDAVRLIIVMYDNCKAEIANFSDPPLRVAQRLYEEEKKSIENRKTFEAIDDEYLNLTPTQIAGAVMKELTRLNTPLLNLLHKSPMIAIPTKIGVAFHVDQGTLKLITEMIEKVFKLLTDKAFDVAPEDALNEFLISGLKLLRTHLLASLSIRGFKMPQELQKAIMNLLDVISAQAPTKEIYEECNEILSSCFEVFYSTPEEKLAYLIEILDGMNAGKEFPENIKALHQKIFAEMACPYKLYPALVVRDEKQAADVAKVFEHLVDLASKDSQSLLNGENISINVIKFLEIAQLVLFAQAASENYQGKWQEILTGYTVKFVNNLESLMRHVQNLIKEKVSDDLVDRIEKTLLNKATICLLNMLVLCKMSLDFLAKALPALSSLIAAVTYTSSSSKQFTESKMVGGVSTVTEIYESAHNYPDNSNFEHTVKIPFAKKYTLKFDPQCKTENGCDYLECWLDEAKSNKFARWEGENFPKEPVVVDNPFLIFTFHSDGSVNYWGWKIEIEALVECEFLQQPWPETIKEACGIIIGSISHKLISGDFDIKAEDDGIAKVLENPLLMYGIQDKYLAIVKTPEPLNESLFIISTTPGINDKFRPVMLTRAYSEDVNRRVIRSQDLAKNLGDYVEDYGQWGEPRFTDDPFLQELIEGDEKIQKAWELVKRKAQVLGPESKIGGNELDQAERAIFAVYTAYFEMSGTMKKFFENPGEVSQTLKYIIKASTQIRVWAQRHRQKNFDNNVEMSYTDIGKVIVKKCCFLLAAEYKMSLNEIGVTKVLKNLSSTVKAYQKADLAPHKEGSKWKKVGEMVETSKKLKGLVNIAKSDGATSSDQEELMKIIDLVNGFLESQYAIEKVVEVIEGRRSKAIARTLGFLCLANLINFSAKHETWLVRAFSTALKVKGQKEHYWKGLEGTDPFLLSCLQKAFFQVYGLLQKELIKSRARPFTITSYSHYISVLEAMSCPLRGVDAHMILELQFPSTLHILFSWAKGYLGEEVISKPFLKENCVTEFSLVNGGGSECRLLLEAFEDKPSLYLQFEKGGNSQPVTDFMIIPQETMEGYDDAVGEFLIKGVAHRLFIKREAPKAKSSYLTSFDGLNPILTKYEELLGEEKENDKKKRENLKLRLSKSAWALYKLIMYSIVGSWVEYNEQKKILVQEMFVRALFTELKWDEASNKVDDKDINISEASSGELWLAKALVPKSLQKNAMVEWMRRFTKETEHLDDLMIKKGIQEYVEKVDPAMKGVLNEIDISYIDKESAQKLQQFDDNKNSKGQYDFFKYLQGLKRLGDELPYDVQNYMETSELWESIPEDFYEAMKEYNFSNISRILENTSRLLTNTEGDDFRKYIDAWASQENVGIAEKVLEDDPAEFKNSAGKLDFFLSLHAIIKNQEKFFNYYIQLEKVFEMYDDLPTSCEEIYKERHSQEDYITSLLWTLLGCFGSECLGKVLSRPEYFEEILKITFLSKSEKTITLGFRILVHILPLHHSPQTIVHMWNSLIKSFQIPDKIKIIPFLLKKIGKGMYSYGLKDRVKLLRRWTYESQNLLLALSHNTRWKAEIIKTLTDLITEAIDFVVSGKQLDHTHTGAMFFLSNISKHCDSLEQVPIELTAVTLADSSLAKAVVKKIVDTNATVYSVIEDTTITEPLTKISGVEQFIPNKFYEGLTQAQNATISELVLKFWKCLEDNQELSNCKELVGNLRILYNKLGMAAINAYTSIIEHMDVSQKQAVDIMCMISSKYKELTPPSKAAYEKVITAVSNTNRSEVKTESAKKMTDEEAYAKLSQMNEESQIVATELISLDIPIGKIIKCFDLGIKDLDGVLGYNEPVVEEKPAEFLYQLSTLQSMRIKDVTGTAEIYQNSMSHLVIKNRVLDNTHKEVAGGFEKGIFHNIKEIPEVITIVAALEGKPNSEGNLTFGLMIGDLKIEVNNKCGIPIMENTGSDYPIDKVLVLRIFAMATGDVNITNETIGEQFKMTSATVYNGLKIGDFGVFLEEGDMVELLSFDIHVGKFETKIDKKFERPKILEGGERYVKCKPKGKATERCRLKILGFNDEEISEAMLNAPDFPSRIDFAIRQMGNRDLSSQSLRLDHEVILDILLVDTIADIPKGYKKISVYENDRFVDFQCPGQRIAVVKKEEYKAGKICSGISLLEEAKDYEKIGDLSLVVEGENADWSSLIYAKLVLPKPNEIKVRDIIFFKTSSVNSVLLPHGYRFLVDKEGKAINVASKKEKGYYMFMAVLSDDTLMDSYVNPYHTVKVDTGSFGMVDKFEQTSAKGNESLKEYEDMSPVELAVTLYDFEKARTQSAVKSLFINLGKKSEKVFMQILEEGNIQTILKIVKNNLKELSQVFELLFRSADSSSIKRKIVTEILREMLSCIVGDEAGGKVFKSLTIESAHPYDNNMDVDQVITIPGASSLHIAFDPACHTESGCDPLRFYEQSGRVGELRNISGQGESIWTPFDVQGDTVHSYFHSDGSVVYWGYKFDVTPVSGTKAVVESPDTSLWLLQKIAALDDLSNEFEVLMSPRVLQTIFILSLSSSSLAHKQACIEIIRKLLRGQHHSTIDNIIKMFVEEAGVIYTEHKKNSHPLLQSLILLIANCKDTYNIKLTDEWLIGFSELLSDMRGLCDKDESLDYFLFESFKTKLTKSMTTVYESEHPYKRKTLQTMIKAPLASFIAIDFDEHSKLDPRDEILFTYDSEFTKKCILSSGSLSQALGVGWDTATTGPDISINNGGLTVTRTNSNGWGCALWTESYSASQIKINFHIDNDGGSEYLYIGVANTADLPTLNSCINSDLGKDLWTWKKNGDIHKRGSNSNYKSYKTGDTISILIDMNLKEIAFIKDDMEVHKFSGLSNEVRPIICFGGSGQIVTVLSVEKSGANAPIEKRKLKIPGDCIYCSFPVNIGATKSHHWQANPSVASNDVENRVITKLLAEKSIHCTSEMLSTGKNYVEVTVNSTGKLALGFSLNENIKNKELENFNTTLYESTGTITFHREESKCEEFTLGDVIGCYYDFEKLVVKFYKNGKEVFSGVTEKLEGENTLGFCAVLYEEKQSLAINEDIKFPIDEDLIKVDDSIACGAWGYKFTATVEFKGRSKDMIEAVTALCSPELKAEWQNDYLPKFTNYFKNGAVEQLVMYLDEYVGKVADKNIMKLTNEDINPTPEELIYYPDLEKVPLDDIRELYAILMLFNNEISKDMNLINLHIDSYDTMTELQRVFMGSRNYIFFATKISTFKELLSKTNSDSRPEITVDRPKAMRHRHRKDVDALGQFSIYGQIFRAMNNRNNNEFRNSERIFRVTYRGEAAIDAGGPYNEVISNICDELQSTFLHLLIPTPNNSHNMGENRDCWIVNSSATTKNDMDLFFFLGKIMGAAIRTQNNLNLSLPPLFWKRLLLDSVNIKDLRSIDVCLVQILEILRNPEANKITPETFSQSYDEKFTAKDSSGREIELKENGKNIPVSYENAREYSELVEKFRLNENQEAYDMIRKGMSAVIPMDYLNLLSWRQVQTLVCGAPDINIDILSENTTYEDCSINDAHIKLFWEVMKEMTTKEKSLYLKFVWGRSRLPAGRDFRKMKIARYHAPGSVNNYLPVSHTCFFTIDLPQYTTKDAMKGKLLYAITHCTAIDLDGTASAGWEEND